LRGPTRFTLLREFTRGHEKELRNLFDLKIDVIASKKPIFPKTLGQAAYLRAIYGHDITFGLGPAGTGKTYTITGMVVRLVAENVHGAGDDISNILVVTFTKAATQELKDRIIKRLRECRLVLKNGKSSTKDPFLISFHQLYKNDNKALKHIQKALHQIDDLSVFTIHSFAQRVIQQYGPRAGVDMSDEIITDKQEVTSELIYDYWRQTLARAEGDLASKAVLQMLLIDSPTPDEFAGRYSDMISDSTVPLNADFKISDWEQELSTKQQVFEELLHNLPGVIDNLGALFSGAFKLSKSYFKEKKWRDVEGSLHALSDLEYFFELDDGQVDNLEYLGYQNIQEKFNKGCTYDHLSLDAATIRWMKDWQMVLDNYQEFRSASSDVLMHILQELQERYFSQLDERRAYTYDDILYTANKLIQDVPEIRKADFILDGYKFIWSKDDPFLEQVGETIYKLSSKHPVVLTRVEQQEGIEAGQTLGVNHFQGWHVDRLLSSGETQFAF